MQTSQKASTKLFFFLVRDLFFKVWQVKITSIAHLTNERKKERKCEIILPSMEMDRRCVVTPESILNSVFLLAIALAQKQRSQKPCFNFKGISVAYEAHFSFFSSFFTPLFPFSFFPHKGPPLFAPTRYGCGPLNFPQSHFYPREKVNPCIMNDIMSLPPENT